MRNSSTFIGRDCTGLHRVPYMLETYQFGELTGHIVGSIAVRR